MKNPCLIWCVVTQHQAVHALFSIGRTQHWDIQGSGHKDVSAIFDLLLEVVFSYSQLINIYV